MLTGMSTDYYTRLERGDLSGVSDSILDALARALQLSEAERTHLLDLAATANAPGQTGRSGPGGPGPGRPRRSSSPPRVREGVLRVIDSISAPAYVRNNRMDVLAANRLGRALFTDVYAAGQSASEQALNFLASWSSQASPSNPRESETIEETK